ncbi:MAG: ABC transporter ATP-binding protein [Acidobacteriota bacterium]
MSSDRTERRDRTSPSPEAKPPGARQRVQGALRLSRAVRLVWQTAPGWTLANAGLSMVQGGLPLAGLYAMKRIIDAVSARVASPGHTDLGPSLTLWIVVAGSVTVVSAIARALGEYATEMQAMQVTDAVADILHAQSVAVDLEYYEDPAYYDTLHRAQRDAPYRPTHIVNGLVSVAQNGLALVGIAGWLFSFNWMLSLTLCLAALPGAVGRLTQARRLYGFQQAHTERERRAWYYHSILTFAAYAKEVRLFDIGGLFRTRYRDVLQQIREGKQALALRRARVDVGAQVVATLALFATLAWIAYQTIRGGVTMGDLVVYYLGFQSGLGMLQTVLRAVAGLHEDNLFLTQLYAFLDLTPAIAPPHTPQPVPKPMRRGLVCHDVAFTYVGQSREALAGIDLTLAPGEMVALVGENGSGKSTLVKLLCRLYDPTRGTITIDGVNLRDLDPVHWRREIGVTFQDYAHYSLTAAENIWLGDVGRSPDPAHIAQTGRRSGADAAVQRLPDGYDTLLGRWFRGGQELSEGEWQKIALARAFWRQSQIIMLDEPSSSLDPLAEAELFGRFRDLLDGRSAIVVSHRLSTVQLADCIYVMDRGRIAERGTHAALLAAHGLYARLYMAQAERYRDQPDSGAAS